MINCLVNYKLNRKYVIMVNFSLFLLEHDQNTNEVISSVRLADFETEFEAAEAAGKYWAQNKIIHTGHISTFVGPTDYKIL